MFAKKIRTALVTAALAALVVPGGASALSIARPVTPLAPVKARVAALIKDAASAGIPGYDDAACAGLLRDYNTAVNRTETDLKEGNAQSGADYGVIASQIYGQMTSNCMVIY